VIPGPRHCPLCGSHERHWHEGPITKRDIRYWQDDISQLWDELCELHHSTKRKELPIGHKER
jgi:hypothetical protein